MAVTKDFPGSTLHFGPPPGHEERVGWLHDTIKCKDEVIVAQSKTAGHLEEAASKERTARIALERELQEARTLVSELRDRATSDRVENGRLRGMLDMLSHLGTIPKVEGEKWEHVGDAFPYHLHGRTRP